MSIGPDGVLYVSEQLGNRISRFNPLTAQSLPAFANQNLATPRGLDWGPNGDLYVASANGNRVVELNGATGSFVQNFIPSIGAPITLHFASDGFLYVARGHFTLSNPSSIDRFNATTGAIEPLNHGSLGRSRTGRHDVSHIPPAAETPAGPNLTDGIAC